MLSDVNAPQTDGEGEASSTEEVDVEDDCSFDDELVGSREEEEEEAGAEEEETSAFVSEAGEMALWMQSGQSDERREMLKCINSSCSDLSSVEVVDNGRDDGKCEEMKEDKPMWEGIEKEEEQGEGEMENKRLMVILDDYDTDVDITLSKNVTQDEMDKGNHGY